MRRLIFAAMLLTACQRREPIGTRPCGMSLAHSWAGQGAHGYGTADSDRALAELQEDGITAISVSHFAFMKRVSDPTLTWSEGEQGQETFASIARLIGQAHAKGMRVMLKPQIYLEDGEWCGDIAPPDWHIWFETYRAYAKAVAQLAEENHVEYLIAAVELSSATRRDDHEMRDTIAAVRAIYHGPLIYSANWDEAEHVTFWDAVDIIGIQMYAPLRKSGQRLSVKAIAKGASAWLSKYERIAKRHHKKIIVTETGFVNRVGVTEIPYVWPEWLVDEYESLEGDAEQAAGYEALIDTFGRSPHVLQIFWWKWFTDVDGFSDDGPLGFAVRGRFAEHVLRRTCGR
jgi:hypothetical protein